MTKFEPLFALVGFLGSGKTTLLRKLTAESIQKGLHPYVILNDYENANIDAQSFQEFIEAKSIKPVSGSCICCSGVKELRDIVNSIPIRNDGITLLEANGTTDSVVLMSFLAVGMRESFLPPIQVATVDCRSWQKRDVHNELERNQILASSLLVLNFTDNVSKERLDLVKESLKELNPMAMQLAFNDVSIEVLQNLTAAPVTSSKMNHHKAHWSSCSIDIPDPFPEARLRKLLDQIPASILRVKGCTRLEHDSPYVQFERVPNGEITLQTCSWKPEPGPKLITIGPGSDPVQIESLLS